MNWRCMNGIDWLWVECKWNQLHKNETDIIKMTLAKGLEVAKMNHDCKNRFNFSRMESTMQN